MSTSYWLDRTPGHERRTYDAVIVGAGISGLSAAYWLNREDPSLKIEGIAQFHELMRVAGIAILAAEFTAAIGIYGPPKRNALAAASGNVAASANR